MRASLRAVPSPVSARAAFAQMVRLRDGVWVVNRGLCEGQVQLRTDKIFSPDSHE
jgi:hypothetical protein